MEMGIAAVFLALLLLDLLMGEYRKPGLYSMNELGGSVLSTVIAFTLRALPYAAISWLLPRCLPAWRGALSHTSPWLLFPLVALVDDYGNYWLHRLAHQHRLLWRLHKPHHVPAHMNVMMAIRENSFYYLLVPVNLLAPLLVYLGAAQAGAAFVALKLIVVYLQHAAWRWDLWLRRVAPGRWLMDLLEQVFALQDFHHLHHGIGRYGNASSNYGNVMNIFDKLHGTSAGHPHRAQDAYGLPPGVRTESWTSQLFWPLVRDTPAPAAANAPLAASSAQELAAADAVIVTAQGVAIAVSPPRQRA